MQVALKPGTMITLSDEQTLNANMRSGKGPIPSDKIIRKTYPIHQKDTGTDWHLHDLGDGDFLMVKTVNDLQDIRHYNLIQDETFKEGNRQDQVDAGRLWLFQEPKDPENFKLDDLEYTKTLNYSGDDDVEHLYVQKDQDQMARWDDRLAQIIEYKTEDSCLSPEIVLIELGEGDSGGLIMMMIGSNITAQEIVVLGKEA